MRYAIGIDPELAAELDRRIADSDEHPDEVYTWSEIEAELRNVA
jgi:putative addiction module component (TIGR02574 family)